MSNKTPPSTKLFPLSPGGRTALIVGGFFFSLLVMSFLWVGKEAGRLGHQHEMTASVSNAASGDMIWIPAGTFTMGGVGENVPDDETPLHDVKIDGFWIDKTLVTNEQFTKFTDATHYVTVAERPLTAANTPGLLPEFEGKSASLCFRAPKPGEEVRSMYQWWEPVIGANWRHPDGEGSDLKGLEKHPVVHVCYEDALAYCKWAGKRLPTEAEWEYAARGGLVSQPYDWGSELRPGGRWMANTWQGHFPDERRVEDGYKGTSPVGAFPPNGYGLYDMAGNVWELTEDWYRPDTYALLAKNPDREARRNPKGPTKEESLDPDEPGIPKKVTRGGSFLCSENFNRGYRPSARMKTSPDTGLQDTGFRCAKDGPAR